MYIFTVYKYMSLLCTHSLSISTCVCYVHIYCQLVHESVVYTFTVYKYMGLLCTHSLSIST